uniref:WLM domain-containing protein n=1 Tax=viral metagenome TaxID=1070528 RepID=A0A6M3LJW4_9ZZZZ
MAVSQCSGESWVDKPLSAEKFFAIVDDVDFEVDWYCSVFNVRMPKLVRQTQGKGRSFGGSYNPKLKSINYTKPYQGVILHELAHHIAREQGLTSSHEHHNAEFGRVLQEMIDMVL